jgi:tRNA modification GTPase
MDSGDTIAAISSAVGPAARVIVRVSGPLSQSLHRQIVARYDDFVGNAASPCVLRFNHLEVPAWVYTFVAPRSATGEDVVEFHIPGNPLLARMLLDTLVRLGASHAQPGEFTARAYFNGRLDLSEAEGVAAVIAAQNQAELSAARQLMSGELARRLRPVLDQLTETLGLVEVGIDFSEEDVTLVSQDQMRERTESADRLLESLLAGSARFERLSHEPRIVLIGRPNAGKSTLLNALAGHERAIVSPVAGTTRDAIWAPVQLARGVVRMIDVAGVEALSQDDDAIAHQMQHRARQILDEADIVLLVRDSADDRPAVELPRRPDLRVAAKADLGGTIGKDELPVSAREGMNLDRLRARLDECAFGAAQNGGSTVRLALNARHVRAIEESRQALRRARQRITDSGSEVVALELREALDALGQVLGSVTPDDVLGRIFSKFCIGK